VNAARRVGSSGPGLAEGSLTVGLRAPDLRARSSAHRRGIGFTDLDAAAKAAGSG